MFISVVICTWNRSRLLDQTLSAMRELRAPDDVDWELLVVNNNSTDDTDAVIARHAEALPLRRIFEPTPGKSHAANRAVRESNGELIVWTDDDVIVDRDWIAAYVDAVHRRPEATFFGGHIAAWYETPPPNWVLADEKAFNGMLVLRDFGPSEMVFDGDRLPFGANMAIRRKVFDEFSFNTRLGPCEKTEIRGEETELLEKLVEAGQVGIWVPEARVRHFVPSSRLTRKYLWTWFRGLGRTTIRKEGWPEGVLLWGVPRWLYRRRWQLGANALFRRCLGRDDWCLPYRAAAVASGMIHECRTIRRESARNGRANGRARGPLASEKSVPANSAQIPSGEAGP